MGTALRFEYRGRRYEYRGELREPTDGEYYFGRSGALVVKADGDMSSARSIVYFVPETFEYDDVVYEYGERRIANQGETILKYGVPCGVAHRTRVEYQILKVQA